MFTRELLKEYIGRGLIVERTHPEDESICIYNYTNKCQFSQEWDEVTRSCRGLILDTMTGEVLANPFPKFFNLGEHEKQGYKIDENEEPIITEKFDGSLGILYWLNNKPYIATRGSFTSEQAVWATEFLRKNVDIGSLNRDWTYLFEIIYPENKIVVDYNFSGLVFLGSRVTKTGKETLNFSNPGGTIRAERIPATDLYKLAKLNSGNSEGFVAYYPKSDFRVKIKFEEYLRLHRIVTGISEKAIWEMLKDGKDLNELLNNVPDEFFSWADGIIKRITSEFNGIKERSEKEYKAITSQNPVSRKDIAISINKAMAYPSIGFCMVDERDYSHIIWKLVKSKKEILFKEEI